MSILKIVSDQQFNRASRISIDINVTFIAMIQSNKVPRFSLSQLPPSMEETKLDLRRNSYIPYPFRSNEDGMETSNGKMINYLFKSTEGGMGTSNGGWGPKDDKKISITHLSMTHHLTLS